MNVYRSVIEGKQSLAPPLIRAGKLRFCLGAMSAESSPAGRTPPPGLDGIRGSAPADLDALAGVIARIGDLAIALGDDLGSLEVNPLRVDGEMIEALDAVVTWAGKEEN